MLSCLLELVTIGVIVIAQSLPESATTKDPEFVELSCPCVAHGEIAHGRKLIIKGYFRDSAARLLVVKRRGVFSCVTDGTCTGWVFTANLTPSARDSHSKLLTVRLNKPQVPFGRISTHASLAIEGWFSQDSDTFQVLDEFGSFLRVTDRVHTGWVFRCHLEASPDADADRSGRAPARRGAQRGSNDVNHPLMGKRVYWKDKATAYLEGRQVDIESIPTPITVSDVEGDWLWVGRAWIQRRDVMTSDEAIDYYNSQIKSDPDSQWGYRGRANWFEANREHDKAIDDYDRAIALDPDYAWDFNNRGLAKHSKRDFDGAIVDFGKAIELDPSLALPYTNRAAAKIDKHDYEGAIRDLDLAIQIDPQFAWPFNNRGIAFLRLENYSEAIGSFDAALRLDPANAEAYNNRGIAKRNLKDFAGAIADFQAASQLRPDEPTIYLNISFLLSTCPDSGLIDPDESLRLALKGLALNPVRIGFAKAVKACALAAQGKFDEAIELQREALEDPSHAENPALSGGEYAAERIDAWSKRERWLSIPRSQR